MRRLILLITAVWLLTPVSAWCYDLLIVQSQRSPVYDEVLRGFHSDGQYSERVIVLTDYNEIDLVRIVREENPVAIITLGDNALAAARKARQTPIIALMALSYREDGRYPALTGVEVQSPPERYLPIFSSLKASRVGIVINSTNSAAYLKQARKVASRFKIELVVREVKSSRDVSQQLGSLAGLVDALWMLPDSITASGEAADAHFLFAASNKVPVVTFSSVYLASGAALAVDIDRFDIGRQGGKMAASLMDGDRISNMPPQAPRKITIKSNPTVLRRLNLNPEQSGSWSNE